MNIAEFCDSISSKLKIETPEAIINDGRLHRFHVKGDRPGSKNGWYIAFDGDVPVGIFGSWKTGEKHIWCAQGHKLTKTERTDYAHKINLAHQQYEAEVQSRQQAAQERAQVIWRGAGVAPNNHPYLVNKGVQNHGLRSYKGTLVIPMSDENGTLLSLQFIDGNGNKRFLSGGRKIGCHFVIGSPMDCLCIAEGYATAASIHEVTDHAVAVAFDCGNLKSVALALRKKYAAIKIVLCADNDTQTIGNPGLTKAIEAAQVCGGLLAVPPMSGDFNDMYVGGK